MNNGDGTFTDVSQPARALKRSGDRRGTSASWGDFDRDGLLDLYSCATTSQWSVLVFL